jgi:hypothetical protein
MAITVLDQNRIQKLNGMVTLQPFSASYGGNSTQLLCYIVALAHRKERVCYKGAQFSIFTVVESS